MIEITCGLLIAISVYLLLEPLSYRKIFGFILLGTTINIILLCSGRLIGKQPAFIKTEVLTHHALSNPLPQALILTAIVIGFGLLVYLCVLLKTIESDKAP